MAKGKPRKQPSQPAREVPSPLKVQSRGAVKTERPEEVKGQAESRGSRSRPSAREGKADMPMEQKLREAFSRPPTSLPRDLTPSKNLPPSPSDEPITAQPKLKDAPQAVAQPTAMPEEPMPEHVIEPQRQSPPRESEPAQTQFIDTCQPKRETAGPRNNQTHVQADQGRQPDSKSYDELNKPMLFAKN